MFTVIRYSCDHIDAAQAITSVRYETCGLAVAVAKYGSSVTRGDYYAVYSADGEQLAGLVNGKQVM